MDKPIRTKKNGEPWKTTKGFKFEIEVLSKEELERIIRLTSLRYPTGIRNRALIAVGCYAGLRLSEALGLELKDIDFKACSINVRYAKGKKQRVVGLDSSTAVALQRWIDIRRRDKKHNMSFSIQHKLFCTLKGEPLSDFYVRAFMRRLGERAGVEKRVHYHALRHFYSFQEIQAGTPVNELKDDLGHANISTTNTYVNHVAPMARIERAKKRQREVEI